MRGIEAGRYAGRCAVPGTVEPSRSGDPTPLRSLSGPPLLPPLPQIPRFFSRPLLQSPPSNRSRSHRAVGLSSDLHRPSLPLRLRVTPRLPLGFLRFSSPPRRPRIPPPNPRPDLYPLLCPLRPETELRARPI